MHFILRGSQQAFLLCCFICRHEKKALTPNSKLPKKYSTQHGAARCMKVHPDISIRYQALTARVGGFSKLSACYSFVEDLRDCEDFAHAYWADGECLPRMHCVSFYYRALTLLLSRCLALLLALYVLQATSVIISSLSNEVSLFVFRSCFVWFSVCVVCIVRCRVLLP